MTATAPRSGGVSASVGARSLGRYVLYGEIAAGGMATIHLGRVEGSVGFSRAVAIKRLHPQFAKDPDFVSMFLDEGRLTGRIRHPNVVPTLDVVAMEGELFIVMEYVHGESFSRLMRALRQSGAGVPPSIAASICAGVLHGLHAAHELKDEHGRSVGLVHRDVSPQNVLVGTDGVARVLDFGVAKAAGRLQTTRDGQLKGKISYMAPEQVRGGAATRQSDLYAVAVVLWEALTARRLFEGDNEAVVLARVLDGAVVAPSAYAAMLPRALDKAVLRGLAREAPQRYATAREMAQALEASMPLASAAEVGEWVERVAAEPLARRAAQVAEIEGSVSLNGPQARSILEEVSAAPRSRRGEDVETKTAVPSPHEPSTHSKMFAGARTLDIPSPRPKRTWIVGVVIVIAGFAVGFLLFLRAHGLGGGDTAAAIGAPSLAPATPEPSPAATPSASATTTASDDTAAPPHASASASVARDNANPKLTKPHAPPTPPAITTQKPSRADCDPPWTIDAAGHKIYKLNCM